MPRVDLFIEINSRKAMAGLTLEDQYEAPLPTFIQEDTISFRVYLIQSNGPEAEPTRITTTGRDIQMAIGRKIANTSTLYTQQFTWTPNSADLSDPYWEADLPMDTAAIRTLIGSASSGSAWFSVKMFDAGEPLTVLMEPVSIDANVIKDDAVTVPTGLTALTTTVAANTYQPLDELKLPTYAYDAETGMRVRLYIDSSNVFHADPVT
jgi:hypothetical protein